MNRKPTTGHWRLAPSGWTGLALLLALPSLLPLGVTLASFGRLDAELWGHLRDYVLPDVLPATLWLLLGVSLCVSILGTGLAALTALCEFPGRGFFSWALLLPLAMPAYVLATAFIGLADYGGPVATPLRNLGIAFPEVRNLGGVIVVMSLALYPYVYLVVRGALATQGARALEAARTLGLTPLRAFWRVILPLAAPAIAGGTLLAAMETLADFGTVAAFNYDTFTTAIYKAWFALFSIDAALQLAGLLILLVLALLALQGLLQRGRSHVQTGPLAQPVRLRGARALAAVILCLTVLAAGFGVPVLQLCVWAVAGGPEELNLRFLRLALNSVSLGLLAAAMIVAMAALLAYALRQSPVFATRAAARIATLGYAFPGALLAIGLFVPLAASLRTFETWFGWGAAMQGSLLLMLLAYAVRFTAVAHAPLVAGLARIRPSLDEAARLMGVTGAEQIARVHLPLLRPAVLAGFALVLVDVMKEMPITLMTRPFGWDTLAVRVFELTSEGQWQRAALPSLGIVLAGLGPVIFLMRELERGRPDTRAWN